MKARYQYRIYPTDQQKRLLSQLFGCVRVVWNDTLAYCQELYRQGEKKPKYTELSKRLTQIKKTTEKVWLTEVSSIPLQQSLRDLETAYSNFFASCKGERKGRKVKPPKFKKRKSKQSARFTDNGFTITVIKDAADRYFLSFVVEIQPEILPNNGESVGIDLGIATFATLSTGEKIDAPKPLKKQLKRLRRASEKPF